jgi:hypothetical protein
MRSQKSMSLASRGSYIQFAVAAGLVFFIPLLVGGFLMSPLRTRFGLGWGAVGVSLTCCAGLVALGFAILLKYPINIVRLRRSLEQLESGVMPSPAALVLIKDEDDLAAIETYMHNIIEQTKQRIETIEQQSHDLVEKETQRAMIESLGAACHHLGQPATIITTYLAMMRRKELPEDVRGMIEECEQAAEKIGDILDKLRSVTEFSVESYLPHEDGTPSRPDERILHLE